MKSSHGTACRITAGMLDPLVAMARPTRTQLLAELAIRARSWVVRQRLDCDLFLPGGPG